MANRDLGRFSDPLSDPFSLANGSWQELFFGNLSQLSQVYQNFNRNPKCYRDELQGLLTWLKNENNTYELCKWTSLTQNTVNSEIIPIADAMIAIMGVAIDLIDRKSMCFEDAHVPGIVEKLTEAINKFGSAWPDSDKTQIETKPDLDKFSRLDNNKLVEKLFTQLKGCLPAIAYWIARDLLDRWVTNGMSTESQNDSVSDKKTMTTLVVGADQDGGAGALLGLTVELIPCDGGGVFCPDPVYLGFTTITHSDPQKNLCFALQNVWNASGLARWFRARWRLETHKTHQTCAFSQLSGASIQAAALCALLAASGDPYRPKEDEKPDPKGAHDPLAPNVVISATLKNRPHGKTLIQTPLGNVSGFLEKLKTLEFSNCLKAAYVDTFILSEDDLSLSGELTEFLKKSAKDEILAFAGRGGQSLSKEQLPSGVNIITVETVEQALDLMLVRNRYLKAYQAAVRDQWLKGWQKGTARFKGDTDPGPDDLNEPDASNDQ